jgi:hypothetical protein
MQSLVRLKARSKSLALWLAVLFSYSSPGADIPKIPVPSSPYIGIVYRYADTMLEHSRDTYGPRKTGLFLSALDRATLQPLTNRPPAPTGIREQDRVGAPGEPLTGANPEHDENLLRVLYTLTELSTKTKYREAADAELKWFLENAANTNGALKSFRPWMLWDRCFQVSPQGANSAALALSEGPTREPVKASVREAGFLTRTWAIAYAKTKDAAFLKRIGTLLDAMNNTAESGGAGRETLGKMSVFPTSSAASIISLAIDCDGAAHHVPGPLASRLRALAARADESFCSLPHKLKEKGGFTAGTENQTPTPLWQAQHGQWTTAQIGMMCVSRYDNTGKIPYRDLMIGAADAYLNALPEESADVWPGTFGQAISLEIAAWRHTARPEYFERARKLADLAVAKFLDKSPLPRASFKSQHYESITGADTLMLSLLELHLNVLHITAVRCPPNTIDR